LPLPLGARARTGIEALADGIEQRRRLHQQAIAAL